ncbi:amino acid adenylation domain-containing protein, partial [Micromonospora sp. NPDC000207]|uniref:non-ribosomal peptide synthetase n=1 Tax=Micromonospora sp. NPDC000207 TaxID=3154246 RepID=UPI0033244D62
MTSTANEPNLREELVKRRLAGRRTGRRDRITVVDRSAELPLSFGQQQMWFHNRMDPTSAEFLVSTALRLRGRLDVAALRRAWSALLARHEILRTRYALVGAEPVQVIDPVAAVDLPVTDLTDRPAADREAAAADLVARVASTGFDLEQEQPVRAGLVRLADDDHVLALVLHHIACDAPSVAVLTGELAELYRAASTGTESRLPVPAVQFADFAAWQRTRLDDDRSAASLAHWRDRLAGVTPVELPADRTRPLSRDWRGSSVPFEWSADLSAALHDLARRSGTTTFVTVLAAFGALLSRYTGRTDLTIGTVSSLRTRAELRDLVGYGIDNLVVRARWEGDPSFDTLLAQTRATVLDAFDHAEVPFARLVDELEPERDLARTPLYQVACTLQDEPPVIGWAGGLTVTPMELPLRTAKTDLTLHLVQDAGGRLRGRLEYATALFDRATVERTVGHLTRLVGHVTADPTARISDLTILDDVELAEATRGAVRPTPVDGTLHGRFAATVAAAPHAPALTVDGTTVDYAGLDAAANRLAHLLGSHGAAAERLVAVHLDTGPDLVPTLLGVLKSGAAYLPLDPTSPQDRLDFMLADAGARIVVTSTDKRDRFADFDGTVVLLDDPDLVAELAAQPATDPDVPVDVDNLCYVIYTSGSTGRPKGVAVAHRQVLRLFDVTADDFGFGPDDVWSCTHSYAFDMSVWEIWGALSTGGRLVVVPRSVARAPEELLDLLVAERVTVLNQTPSAFPGLVRFAADGDPRVDRLALRVVTFGGEKLDFVGLAPWVARRDLETTRLVNLYGITETTVHTTYHPVADVEVGGTASPVGVPLGDLTVHLLDPYGRPVPVGVPGEIHVGGPGVARGYLGRPGLTAQRFVPDPWGPSGSRLYRSGDLARRRPGGGMEFLGRIDHQVKIRGYRVELGEIEAALTALPGVRDAVVVLREDTPGDRRLTAYLVAGDDPLLLRPSRVRAELTRTLPDYMVPTAFVPLTRIPLTVNGKLDRAALPTPDRSVAAVERPYLAPRTTVEQQLADVWAATLGLERVGVLDGFFDLGGDSIRAVALAGALRDAHFDVEVRDLFERRTVADLAELITARPAAEPEPAVVPFALVDDADRSALPAGVVDAYPCTQGQLGMLVELLADTERNHYHNVTSYRVHDEGEFSLDALRAAAALLVARHEVLRTSFDLTGYAVPMQLVHATAELAVTADAARATERADLERELRDFIAVERTRLFDLDRPGLLRLHARTCPDGSWWLTLTECHPILDGWSYHSLIMEVVREYRRIRAGLPVPPHPAPTVRFADAVAAERRSVAAGTDGEFWRRTLTGRSRHELPTGWGDPDAPEGVKHERWVPLQDLEPQLRSLARTLGVPFKSVMLAAHLKVMSQLTGAGRFYTGLVCNIRPEAAGADRVYGMHLNTVPVGYDGAAATWAELVRRTFTAELELWPHRRYPLSTLQREVGEDTRLLDVRFSYHDFHQIDATDIDYAESIDDSPTEFPLGVFSRLGFVTLQADRRHIGVDALRRLGGMYRAVLEAMVADPGGDARVVCLPVGEVSVVGGDDASVVEPVSSSVSGWFAGQVVRVPSAEAVNGVTFADLDARPGVIAGWLVSRGVGRGDVVGVLADRGPDLVAAMLGVWKAGGAYVPVDPSYPAGRIEAILADAGAVRVLTSGRYADRFPVGVDVLVVGEAPVGLPVVSTPEVDLDDLAYVIFTSGSTGRPKGVQVTQRGLANHVRWAAEVLAGAGSGGSAVFSSVAFDLQVPNLWAPLVVGQRVFMVDQDVDLAELGRTLVGAGPFSFLKLTPSHLEILGGQVSDAEASTLASVVVAAGEALPAALANRWLELLGPGKLINEYGPTEVTVGTCIHPVDGEQTLPVVPIGRALPGLRMFVLTPELDLAPIGVTGELYVGGVGVARGYAGQPGLTAGRFVPDPYGPAGSRLYRTGDLTRRLADGVVEFVGRVDDQVKIRGYRIELGEIETVVAGVPGVRDAVALVLTPKAGEPRLVCCYLPEGPDADLVERVRQECVRHLPDYLVPADLVAVDAIPLNANGKVDRVALAASVVPEAREQVAPRTDLERRLADIWAEVLSLDTVGVTDSFFDLGGDSLRAVALVGALRLAGHPVGVRDVFVHRTVAALAAHLSAAQAPAAPQFQPVAPFTQLDPADRAALPDGLADAYPITQAQLGMLAEMQKDPDRSLYHIVRCFRVHSRQPFTRDALTAAVEEVVARHETLRTSFDLGGRATPLQLVHAGASPEVRVDPLDEERAEAQLREYVDAERARPFDSEQPPPLLRVGAHVAADGGWWLTVSVSHLVTGGWDLNSLLAELLSCYERHCVGMPPESPEPVAVRYADFVAAERAALDSEDDKAYWREVTSGYAKLTAPAGWGTPTAEPGVALRHRISYQDLDQRLRDLASALEVSPKAVLHAAHLKVMSQLTDEVAFSSGLVCDARPEVRGAERVHGMYINVLPFGFVRGVGSWRELVRSVFDGEVGLWPHRRYPLAALRRLTGSDVPPVDVVFDYTEFRRTNTDSEESVGFEAVAGEGGTEFALQVTAASGFLDLVSDARAFDAAALVRLAGMFRVVLESMVADVDGDAWVACLPSGEWEWLSGAGSGPVVDVSGVAHSAFEGVVVGCPGAVAVSVDGVGVSYGEVNARANGLAWWLRSVGVGPEVLVGVCLDRSVDLVVALVAVHKAGGVYVPLDPSYPAGRLGLMVGDAAVSVVVTSEVLRSVLPEVSATVLTVDEIPADLPTENPPVRVDPDNAAYVIFTSGSTGRPKGAILTHAGLVNRTSHVAPTVNRLDGSGVVLQKTEIGFDVSPAETYAALSVGARLVVARPGGHRDPAYLRDLIVAEGVTAVELVPSLLAALLAEGITGCTSLRSVGVGGEELPVDLARSFLAALPGVELHNTYGPAETTVDVTSWACTEELTRLARVPLGRPFPNLTLRVLDDAFEPVPVGAPGELFVGGVAVGRGYLGAGGLTAGRFVPDPFGPAGSRLYRTGDAVAWRVDGTLEFLGRIDAQVKVHGVRIELGEVESALRACPGVRDAVAAVVDVDGRPVLTGYLLPEPTAAPDPQTVRNHLRDLLPEALVPTAYLSIDAIPVDPNGKIDRRQLPAPTPADQPTGTYVAPANPVEAAVAQVWAQVLGVDVVGVTESFFDLGGDSMLAVTLVGALRAAGHPTSVRDVFARRTVRDLVASFEGGPAEVFTPVEPFALLDPADRAGLPGGLADAYPATQAQIGMAVEAAKDETGTPYHIVHTMRVPDDLPFAVEPLRETLADLVARHDTLRTSVDLTGWSVPLQLVHATADVPVTVHPDAAGHPGYVAAERDRPFDPAQPPPLLRVAVHQADDQSWWLTVSVSHLVTGGWDFNLLLADLIDGYHRRRRGAAPAPVDRPPLRYADFVAAERAALDSADDVAYWRTVLAGRPPITLPGTGAPGRDSRQVHRHTVDLTDLTDALRATAATVGVPVKAVLHAAHLKVMSQLTDEVAFSSGLVCDARPEVRGAERVHGMYINVLP